MIPKVIHYCWLSGEQIPFSLVKCMDTWKVFFPDYEFKLWTTKEFDIQSVPFVKDAFMAKKYAIASDYIRLYALYTYGGIYLDMDVEVLKPFDALINERCFTAVEYHPSIFNKKATHVGGERNVSYKKVIGLGIQAAVIGAEKEHPYIKSCLDFFVQSPNTSRDGIYGKEMILPDVMALVAEGYGFRYTDREQFLSQEVKILPSKMIAGCIAYLSKDAMAIHHCKNSWVDKTWYRKLKEKVVKPVKDVIYRW